VDLCELQHATPSERRHPWETARRDVLRRILDAEGFSRAQGEVLDVGSGDAWLVAQFLERAPGIRATAWDINYTPQQLESLAGPRLRPTAEEPEGTYGWALLLDVIEHVADDVALLRTVAGKVEPGGTVLVSVPAWPRLMSQHDVHLGHFRRYTPRALRAAVEAAGLTIVREGGMFGSLLAARALQRIITRRRPSDAAFKDLGAWQHGTAVTAGVHGVLLLDGCLGLAAGGRAPGLSCWALARRPSPA
jgi:SAM-dependent methyltransferase